MPMLAQGDAHAPLLLLGTAQVFALSMGRDLFAASLGQVGGEWSAFGLLPYVAGRTAEPRQRVTWYYNEPAVLCCTRQTEVQ